MIDLREALRYAGVPSPDGEMLQKAAAIAEGLEKQLHPRSVWRCCPLE